MIIRVLAAVIFLAAISEGIFGQAIRIDVDEFTAGSDVTESGFLRTSDVSLVDGFIGPVSALNIVEGVFINAYSTVDGSGGFSDRGIYNADVPPGPFQNLMRDSIRHIGSTGSNGTIWVQINDLPGGKYLFNTYHHDYQIAAATNADFDIFVDDAAGNNQPKVVDATFSNDVPFDHGQQFQVESAGFVSLRIVSTVPQGVAVFNGMQIIPITGTIHVTGTEFSTTTSELLEHSDLLDNFLFYEIVYDGVSELKLDTFGTPNSTDTEIALYNHEGTLLGANDDIDPPNRHSELVFDDLQPGTYYLAVAGYNTTFSDGFLIQQTGNLFTPGDVTLNINTASEPIVKQDFVLSGSSFSASFNYLFLPGSIDFFQIDYDGESPFTIDTNGSAFDTEIGLYDSEGILIANDDDGGMGLQSQLTCQSGLPAGTYYLVLGGHNTTFGDQFDVTTNSNQGGFAAINIRSETPSTVDTFETTGPGYVETDIRPLNTSEFYFYTVQVTDQGPLTIDTLLSSVDTHIALFNSSGDLVAENDNSNDSLQSELVFEELSVGNYYLAVSGGSTNFQDCFGVFTEHVQFGSVTVRVATAEAIAGDINCDGAVNLLDVDPFINLISTGGYSAKADMNGDGTLNLLDVGPFIDALSGI